MSYSQIEDQRDNPITRAPRDDEPDRWLDDITDRQAERFNLLTRTPVIFHSAAVIEARARLQAHIAERALHAAADSHWMGL